MFENTGTTGGAKGMFSSTSLNRDWAAATRGEWKALATARRLAPRPCASHQAIAFSIASVGPEITVCRGEFRFASVTPHSLAKSWRVSDGADTAAIVPGSPP